MGGHAQADSRLVATKCKLMEEPLDTFVLTEAIARLDRAATALEHAAEKAQVAQEATG